MLVYLTPQESDLIYSLLSRYANSSAQWDEWRVKNWPEEIEEPWAKVMRMCRNYGYIFPYAKDGVINWFRVRLDEHDECTLCPNKECRGVSLINGHGKKEFTPCWEVEKMKPTFKGICPKCGREMSLITIDTYPPIYWYNCKACDFSEREEKKEKL